MKGWIGLYLWVCVVGYVTRGGVGLPTILGNDLIGDEGEDQGMTDWVQGEETPLGTYWGVPEEEEDEGDALSPDSDKRQYPGGKRQYPGGKRQYPGGKRQYPGGKRQYPGGKRQYPGGKRQYPGGKRQYVGGKQDYIPSKRQFVGGELIPAPELRQYPGGKRQYPGGKRQYPGGKRQYPGGKRQYPGGKRSDDSEQDTFPMEIRQYPGGKRQFPAGKRQYPGGKRQFPGGKRQFVGGEPLELEALADKRFPGEDDVMDFIRLAQLYAVDNDMIMDEEELELEDLLDDIMVDTRPELGGANDMLLGNENPDDALAIDLSALLEDRNGVDW